MFFDAYLRVRRRNREMVNRIMMGTKLRQDLLNREIIKIERVELDEKVIIIAFDNTDFFYEL